MKGFIMRGNVIDLAVAVVIGAAFTAIVNGLVDGIFNPIISALFDADDIAQATVQIGSVNLGIGLVIAAVIQFLLISAIVYFVLVLPMNTFKERAYVRKHGHPEPEAAAEITDVELLTEIRDLLKSQQQSR